MSKEIIIDKEKAGLSEGTVEQRIVFESGNEMAAYAAHKSTIISWAITQFLLLQKLLNSLME